METLQNILFITFRVARQDKEYEVHCCGCREIIVPDYKKPVHIKGLMDFNHRYIPVVDPGFHFSGKPTHMTDSTCILVVSHNYEYRELETGILIQDIKEILNLAAGIYSSSALQEASYNIRFVTGLVRDIEKNIFLTDCHLSMNDSEKQKRIDEDFITFKDIVTRRLAYA